MRTGENIFKIGKTTQYNNTQFKQYPKGSILYFQLVCDNCHDCERKIIGYFKNKFIQKIEFGNEYFEGNLKEMIAMVYNIVLCKNETNDESELETLNKLYNSKVKKQKLKINNYKNKFENCMNNLLQMCNKHKSEIKNRNIEINMYKKRK